jgi:ferredoxin
LNQDTGLRAYFVNFVCCNGCGACVEMESDLFAYDDTGEKAVTRLVAAPEEAVRKAMAFCPNDCIEIEE